MHYQEQSYHSYDRDREHNPQHEPGCAGLHHSLTPYQPDDEDDDEDEHDDPAADEHYTLLLVP